jgi:cardiolipin synthase (CMP-forming)
MLKHLPNALTLIRLVLAPVIALAIWQAYAVASDNGVGQETWALTAAGLFLLAALTDLVDGMAARALNAESKFGRLIDPIADKALVGLPLIAISIVAWQIGQPLWWLVATATAVIVLRDIVMTLARLMSKDGEGARVSKLAKWKTALELVAVGLPILIVATPSLIRVAGLGEDFTAGPEIGQVVMFLWFVLLVAAAFLSVATAVQYALPQKAMAPPQQQNEIEPVETNQLEPGPEGPATLAAPQTGS